MKLKTLLIIGCCATVNAYAQQSLQAKGAEFLSTDIATDFLLNDSVASVSDSLLKDKAANEFLSLPKDKVAIESRSLPTNKVANESDSLPNDRVVNESDSLESASKEPVKQNLTSTASIGYVPDNALKRYKNKQNTKQSKAKQDKLYYGAYEHFQNGRIDLAIKSLNEVIDTNPDHEKARILLGQVFIKIEDHNAAIAAMSPLTKKAESHWSFWYWMGVAHLKQNSLELAKQFAEEAILRAPEQANIWLLRALISQEMGDHQTALQLLAVARQHAPGNSQVILNIAISSEAIGNHANAIHYYTQYVRLSNKGTKRSALDHLVLNRIKELGDAGLN